MAQGDVYYRHNAKREVVLLSGVQAVNNAPSGATAGIPVHGPRGYADADSGVSFPSKPALKTVLMAKGVGSGGTVTMTLRLWGYSEALAVWMPLGTGTDADKGKLNAGAAIGEVGTDVALHAERIEDLGCFDRVYLEVTAIGGTSTTVSAILVTPARSDI